MTYQFSPQEHKLVSACIATAVALSAVIIALIAVQSGVTAADIQGVTSFNAITTNFTHRIEVAVNESLLQIGVLNSLFSVFQVDHQCCVYFLSGIPNVTTNSTISWAAYVLPDQVLQFESSIQAEVYRFGLPVCGMLIRTR
jgi:hypothetical protein